MCVCDINSVQQGIKRKSIGILAGKVRWNDIDVSAQIEGPSVISHTNWGTVLHTKQKCAVLLKMIKRQDSVTC